jgi:hypothetical protein
MFPLQCTGTHLVNIYVGSTLVVWKGRLDVYWSLLSYMGF